MAKLTPNPRMQFFDASGVPLSGGRIETFASGTSTPLATYTDGTGTVANPVVITLDARGEASVWLANAFYRLVVYDAAGALIYSADDIGGESAASELWGGVAGGTANAITFTTVPRTNAHETGQTVKFIALADNTGPVTISPNGLPVKNMTTIGGAALSAGAIKSGAIVYTTYDGTQYQLLSLYLGVGANNAVGVSQATTSTATSSTVTLGTTLRHLLTGTTTITAFAGTTGATYKCRADGAFILTYHATNLIITQTLANITTVAGDTFDVYMITDTTARVTNYVRSSGAPVKFSTSAENIAGTIATQSVSPLGIREAFNCTGTAPVYACRAWLNYNGVANTITTSGNVTSVTDNGVGIYTVNFATALPDGNYCPVYCLRRNSATNTGAVLGGASYSSSPTTTAFQFYCSNLTPAAEDMLGVYLAFFR